jgi:hypothetical protein
MCGRLDAEGIETGLDDYIVSLNPRESVSLTIKFKDGFTRIAYGLQE